VEVRSVVYSRGKLGLMMTGTLLVLGLLLQAGCATPTSISGTTSTSIPSSTSTAFTSGSVMSSTMPEAWLGTTSLTSSPPYTVPAPVFPAEVPPDFGFRAAYGVTAKNVMDTFAGTFTKDLVLNGQATTDLRLTVEEMQSLYRDLLEMQSRWQLFTTPFSLEDTGMFVTPSVIYQLEWSVGDFSTVPIVWDDSVLSSEPKAVALRDWFDKLGRMIEAKPEYETLPPAEGGYD
jgi:hypothetical protein